MVDATPSVSLIQQVVCSPVLAQSLTTLHSCFTLHQAPDPPGLFFACMCCIAVQWASLQDSHSGTKLSVNL